MARATPSSPQRDHRLSEVAWLFFRLGWTAFGGPAAHIAMMREEVVRRRQWVSDEEFLDLVGIANLIPGPTSTELAIYLGYLRAGWLGLLVGGVCFIGPAMLIVLVLAWAYVRYGSLPQVGWLFYGIKPVVVAIIAQVLWELCRTKLNGIWPIIVALLVLVFYLLGINTLFLLFGGGLLFGSMRWAERWRKSTSEVKSLLVPFSLGSLRASWQHFSLTLSGGGTLAAAVPFSLLTLFLTFLKIGALLYLCLLRWCTRSLPDCVSLPGRLLSLMASPLQPSHS